MNVTEADTMASVIAEDVRVQIGELLGPIADKKAAEGVPTGVVCDGITFGLIAMACTFATADHDSTCPRVRKTLHVAVDNLLDQLIAYHAGRINKAGETVQ